MRFARFAFALLLLLGVNVLLSCGGATASPAPPSSSSQVLYIISDGTATTYSIDPASLAATPLEQPVLLVPGPGSLLQFTPSPDDRFVYVVWSDGQNLQHLSAFQTDSSGVPQIPAIQVLNADSLSQFNMHPSGRFAYMLEVTSTNGLYQADIRLFNVQGASGTLAENQHVQGSYGPAPFWPAFLYGFSVNGAQLYDMSMLPTTQVYRQRSVNPTNGSLGGDTPLFSVNGEQQVVIGKVIVNQYQNNYNPGTSYLDVFPNTPNPPKPAVHCGPSMLSYCASATNVQLDPTGRFLFLTDPQSQAVHVAALKLAAKRIADTGSSMPMTSQTPGFAFSPNGSIVYAMLKSDNSLHFYYFDSGSGSLTEGGTPLPLTQGTGICPALYQSAN